MSLDDGSIAVKGERTLSVGTVVLREHNDVVHGRRLAIVGLYSETNRPFVKHAALLASDHELKGECPVPILHMGPPLVTSDNVVHLIGHVGLTNEEIEAVDDWIASVSTQYQSITVQPFQQYVVAPHMVWVYSEENRPLRQRFSCVGYVIEAYRAAEIELLDTSVLPEVTKQLLTHAYPDFPRIEQFAQTPRALEALAKTRGFLGFEDLGIPGDGPWRVTLAGYLFHSADRYRDGAERTTAFVPRGIEDASFPLAK